jgi:hypothetical protein
MILCCDQPRGKFPYLVCQPRCLRPSRLVLSDASHVGNASLPFWCVLQFAPDSASFVLSFALDVPSRSPPFRPTPTYAVSPHVDAIAPSCQKTYNWFITRCVLSLLSLQTDRYGVHQRSYPPSRWLKFHPLRLPRFWGAFGLVCAFTPYHLFQPLLSS